MTEIYQLVGKRHSEYEQDGVLKIFDSLYFVSAGGIDPEVEGQSVREERCPKSVLLSSLKIGAWYEFVYDHRKTSRGTMAFLRDFVEVEP